MSRELSAIGAPDIQYSRLGWFSDRFAAGWFLAFACIFAGQQWLIWNHAAWADEIQAVLIARESSTLSDFYWNTRYEGHPPLWHMYLKIWLVLGLDELTALRAGASFAAGGTTLLVLFFSPFSNRLRLLVSLNYYLLFEHGVISRSYTLGVFIFFAAVALRKHRVVWLFLALLPMVSVQFSLIAIICCFLMWREARFWAPGAAMVALSLALAIVLVSQPPDALFVVGEAGLSFGRFIITLLNMGKTILPIRPDGAIAAWTDVGDYAALTFFAGPLLPVFAYWCLKRYPLAALSTVGLFLFTFVISLSLYPLAARHFGLIIVLTIGLWWWVLRPDQAVSKFAGTAFAYMAICGCIAAIEASRKPFSNTPALAQWIHEQGEKNTLFIALESYLGAEITLSVGPTLDLGRGCMQKFSVLKEFTLNPIVPGVSATGRFRTIDDEALVRAVKDAAARSGGRALLLIGGKFRQNLRSSYPGIRSLAFFEDDPTMLQSRRILEVVSPALAEPEPFPDCPTRPLTIQ